MLKNYENKQQMREDSRNKSKNDGCRRRGLNTFSQSGRSMIEMLGVLAIIGVLSVGGIAGYSKAMTKFKTNQIADQVSTIVTNIKTTFAQQKSYEGLDLDELSSMEIIPKELGSEYPYTNPFGGGMYVTTGSMKFYDYDSSAYIIYYKGLPREACIDLVTKDWGANYGLIAVVACAECTIEGVLDELSDIGCKGEIGGERDSVVACSGGSKIPVPMPPQIAAQACNCTGNTCKVGWKYY